MLQRSFFLVLTMLFTIATISVSLGFSNEAYKVYVWPNILVFLGYSFVRHLFFVVGAFSEDLKNFRRDNASICSREDYTPRVSIIVPAYNEEKVIATSLSHLTTLRYTLFWGLYLWFLDLSAYLENLR